MQESACLPVLRLATYLPNPKPVNGLALLSSSLTLFTAFHHVLTFHPPTCLLACLPAWLPAGVQERRVALSESRPVPQDLLGVLLTAADESGQALNDEELWEDVHDVMGAGGYGEKMK
jgi:hypothetical protein